ncbi:MAG: hypothetical protein ACLF0P_15920 [Thermoanaerobaculia bacterium]
MTTTTEAPFTYTEEEIRSYLPTGWNLVGEPEGRWNPKKKAWTLRVEDSADMRWDLAVKARDAEENGRIEALRLAVDRLYRERLGRRTRGLGF